ncbi:MAG: nucleoside kinase [Bacteroidales bacterium]|jgi:uridine kinase|nr:nucleoside kinase [Bacteroidales bacterium]
MNDNVKQMEEIYCTNTDSKVLIPSGMALLDMIAFFGIKNPQTILGACVNNKVQNLNYRIYSPKTITFLDINTANGRKMYSLSLMFLTYKAVKNLYPQNELFIKHSMNGGYYAEIENIKEDISVVVEHIKKEMKKLVKQNLPFERKILSQQEASDLFEKVGITEKAKLIRNSKRLYANIDILGETVNSFFFEMVPSTSYLNIFDLEPFDKGFIILMPDKDKDNKQPETVINQSKIFSIFQEHKNWVEILGTPYVTNLNERIIEGKQNELIQVSEALHEKKYAAIADNIYKKKDNVKLVLLAGPSSSGKTTSCRRIATQLSVLGIKPLQISLDDYFLDRGHTPKDEKGEYDFECLEALDLEYFNYQMNELLKGNEIELPRFNFVVGAREKSKKKIHLTDNSMIIVEGIHALNPKLSLEINRKNKYFIFVSALTQVAIDRHNLISTSDNRLIRRIVRDYNYRGSSAESTISRWESVRNGEEKHIFPFQENADSIFNSSLLYEIGVLKNYCEPLLMDVPQTSPAYANARRLHQFLNNFLTIKPDYIPPTSIMREFLGGSSFDY